MELVWADIKEVCYGVSSPWVVNTSCLKVLSAITIFSSAMLDGILDPVATILDGFAVHSKDWLSHSSTASIMAYAIVNIINQPIDFPVCIPNIFATAHVPLTPDYWVCALFVIVIPFLYTSWAHRTIVSFHFPFPYLFHGSRGWAKCLKNRISHWFTLSRVG